MWDTSSVGTREIEFYRTFSGHAGIRIPKHYYSGIDESRNRAVLVLEDVSPVRQGDVLVRLSFDDARLLVQDFARLHASWWQHSGLGKWSWLPTLSRTQRQDAWFEDRRREYINRFGEPTHPIASRLFNQLETAERLANKRLGSAPTTLLHADLHLDNIVFKQTGEAVVLDWSRCGVGPAALDLVDLLFMPGDDWLRPLLDIYLGHLRAAGVIDVGKTEMVTG